MRTAGRPLKNLIPLACRGFTASVLTSNVDIGFLCIALTFIFGLCALPRAVLAAGNSGITYQGRILNKDGTPLTSTSVQFQIQIRSPGAESCLMYQEVQTKNMTGSAGAFSITLNDGTGQRTDSSGIAVDTVFANRGTYTFNPSGCVSGTTYTPNTADGRSMSVSFKDENMVAYEQLPSQAVNFVPMAIQAKQIAGFGPTNLLRVDDTAAAANTTPFNSAQFTELNALLGGTSTQYVHSSVTGGAALPVIAGAPSGTAAAGTIWYDSGTGSLKYSNGTATPVVVSTGGGGGGGAVSSITVGSGLVDGTGATGTAITASGTIALPAVGSVGSYYKVTTDAQGRVASGSTSLVESDIPSLVTAGKVSGNTITSGTIAGTTGINTSGNILTSGAVSSGTSSANTLRVFESTNTHKVSITAPASLSADYALVLPTTLPTISGQVLSSDTSGNLSWSAAGSGSVSGVTATAPVVSSGGTAPVISINQATTTTNGYVSSTDWNTFNNKLSPNLNSAQIFVGNASNVATGVAVSGDVSLTNAGAATVAGVKGKAVSAAPTSAGQVLRYDGTNWTPNFVSMFDLRSTVTGTQAFSGVGCLSSQTLTWTSATDNLSCTNISVSGSQVTYSSQTANTVFASPNGSAGAPSFRALAAGDLPAGTLTGAGSTGYVPYYSAASTLANSPVYVNGTSVGVGTTTPASALSVGGSNQLVSVGDGSNTAAYINFDVSRGLVGYNGGTGYTVVQGGTSKGVQLGVNSNTFGSGVALTIDGSGSGTNGYVGIGTASPTAPLQIANNAPDIVNGAALYLTGSMNSSTNNQTAIRATPSVNPSATSTMTYSGVYGSPLPASTTNLTGATFQGVTGLGWNSLTSGTVGAVIGVYGAVDNNAAGTISNAYGMRIGPLVNAGTINNSYGLEIDSQKAGTQTSTAFGLYQAGTNDLNYFAGKVGLGTITPATQLQVAGSVMIGDGGETCGATYAGAIRYNSSTVQFCNGTAWTALSSAGGSYLSTSGGTLSGALTVSSGGASVTGGLNNNSGGIASAGSITGVGANITGSSALTVAAGGTAQNLNLNSSTTGSVNVGTGNGVGLAVKDGGASTVDYVTITGSQAGSGPTIGTAGSDTNIPLYLSTKGTGNINLMPGGYTDLKLIETTNAVNYIAIGGGTTGITPTIQASGSDTNVGLSVAAQGSGNVTFANGNGNLFKAIDGGASTVNYIQVQGGATGVSPVVSAVGSDTNVNLTLSPKGTGNTIVSSGNFGIGTALPGALLEVQSNGITASTEYLTGKFDNSAANKGVGVGYYVSSGAAVQEGRVRSAGSIPLALGTSNQQQALYILDSTGNVGVGTIAPATRLGVYAGGGAPATTGTTTTGITRLAASSSGLVLDMGIQGGGSAATWLQTTTAADLSVNGNMALNPNGGNVGVGTLVPGARLDVNGAIRLDGSTSGYLGFQAPATVTTPVTWTLPNGDGASGNVLTTNGSGVLSWAPAGGTGTVTGVTATAPVVSSGGTAPVISITQATTSTNGYLSSADWNTFNGKLGTTLTSAQIFVGNVSNVATGVTASGDVSLTNTGAFTVGGVKGKAVSAAPTTAGQMLRYDGTNWTPNFVSMFDLRSTVTGTQAFSGVGCLSSQTLTWTSATDNLSCSNIAISGSQVTYASQTANTFFAAPNGTAGAPVFRGIASADLPAGTISGSGTSGYVPYYSGASALSNSVIFTNGTAVGVGTASPSAGYMLETAGAGRFYASSGAITAPLVVLNSNTTAAADQGTGLRMQVGSNNDVGLIAAAYTAASSSNSYLAFQNRTSGALSEKMRIDSAGNVGIGTTSPSAALHVVSAGANTMYVDGYGNASKFYMRRADGTTSSPTAIQSGDVIANFAGIGYGTTGFVTSSGNLVATGAMKVVATENFSDTSAGGAIAFYTIPNGTSGNIERVRIDNSGNVGIGTTSPISNLDVMGSSRGTWSGHIVAGDNGSYNPLIQEYKWTGIGNSFFETSIGNSLNSSGSLDFQTGSGGGAIGYDTQVTRMTITQTGNVGVGTTSPQATMDINGYQRLKIYTGSPPVACSATYDGSIALTSHYTTCVCKGGSSAWVLTADGTTACVW